MFEGVFCIEQRADADADIQLLEKVTADDKSIPLFEHMKAMGECVFLLWTITRGVVNSDHHFQV